jgi:hypothetical protein
MMTRIICIVEALMILDADRKRRLNEVLVGHGCLIESRDSRKPR